MNILDLIGRDQQLFDHDIACHDAQLRDLVGASRFLVSTAE